MLDPRDARLAISASNAAALSHGFGLSLCHFVIACKRRGLCEDLMKLEQGLRASASSVAGGAATARARASCTNIRGSAFTSSACRSQRGCAEQRGRRASASRMACLHRALPSASNE